MENPYRPPRAIVSDTPQRPRRSSLLYNLVNNAYALVIIGSLSLLVLGRKLIIDAHTLYLLLVFFTPVFSYLLVRLGSARQLRLFLLLQLCVLLTLFVTFLRNLADMGLDQGIGYFMIGANLLSYLAAWHHYRSLRRSAATQQDEA